MVYLITHSILIGVILTMVRSTVEFYEKKNI